MSWFVLTDLLRLQWWIRWLEVWWSRRVAWLDVVAAASLCPLMGMSASLFLMDFCYDFCIRISFLLAYAVLSPESS